MKRVIFLSIIIFSAFVLSSCTSEKNSISLENAPAGSMDLQYAEEFSVDYYSNGFSVITIGGTDKFLLVPQDKDIPEDVPAEMIVIKQPVENIYLAASSAMDLFDGINSLDSIRASSTKEKDWSLPRIKSAIENGQILYAGKYSAPDYELILSEKCSLAIQSTMIYHKPEVKEMLENQGIPVMVERSSYEAHPLGRMEWIKLYGLLVGKEKEAEDFFNEKIGFLESIVTDEATGKTAAFFYIGSNGNVNVRKSGDYISKIIELAGGQYAFSAEDLKIDDNDLSTMNIQFETFYAIAKDADFLIYNSTVDGGISDVGQLIEKNSLLADFKAVQNGNVWCTEKNMFQQTTGAADVIYEMSKIFSGETDEDFDFFYQLK
ncbi:MAG: ABC transporter substrate-binding protein [Oscillospiraceae bacterium]|nr:ABC transporter substrate-binding protein [Oscillospiraceae bacterium]